MQRLTTGTAIALDGSTSMLQAARRRLDRFGDRTTYVEAVLAAPPLPVEGPVDAVVSTATLHWITDHDALFAGLGGVVRTGGQLSFQCGGEGNAEALIAAVRAQGVETTRVFRLAGVAEVTRRLRDRLFVDIKAWLQPRTIVFETCEAMPDYTVMPYLRPATRLPEAKLERLATAPSTGWADWPSTTCGSMSPPARAERAATLPTPGHPRAMEERWSC